MTTHAFSVKLNGERIAYVRYQNCADVWCGGAFADAYESDEPIGQWRCAGEHGTVDVACHYGDEVMDLRWCKECQCLVQPPFDGYVYHDYGCELDDQCSCGS